MTNAPMTNTPITTASSVTILKPHVKDLGGFTVKRVLPGFPTRMIGPFIFFDHMGPARFAPGDGIDVRPHPHIGLATVTYLFEGTILHRDTLGTVQPINPGDVNWMTAGRGIAHSERTPDALREAGSALHGLQIWVALPKEHEFRAPSFQHVGVADLPTMTLPGVRMRVIAGSAFGKTSPVATLSNLFYVAVEMEAGASLSVPIEHEERAAYAVDGGVLIEGQALAEHHMAVLPPGRAITITAQTQVRIMLLGGKPLDGDRFIWWNFVASNKDAISAAKERWRHGFGRGFGQIPGETEWIPLPEEH